MATRKYIYKDVETMLASKIVAKNLSNNLEELSTVRSNWTADYVAGLFTKIDAAIDSYLGLDKKKDLNDASSNLAALQQPAMRDLSFIKTQIEVDFGDESEEILKSLGFDSIFREVQKGNQEALIQLLFSFNKGLTEELRGRIVENGTSPALLDRITGYAVQVSEANVIQETFKETTKEVTEEAVNVFNGIYEEVIGICKIASNFYQYEPLKKEQFTFSKIIANMGAAKKASKTPIE